MTHKMLATLVLAAMPACPNGADIHDALPARRDPATAPAAATTATAAATAARSARPAAAVPRPQIEVDTSPYPWHADESIEALEAVDPLEGRFPPPAGFRRVAVTPGSFGAWLRRLPLAAPGTPVRAYDGRMLYPADHRNIAAVTTLDIGNRDLQQCADAIMRLHAEWLWHNGRAEEASYPTGAGPIPWVRFLRGERPVPAGITFKWGPRRRARPDSHEDYRRYLDAVFGWANTVSLAREAHRPQPDELRPGDFFVQPGAPGHAVIVLDLARSKDDRTVALLGQSFMPAQSFQVLRPAADNAWFSLHLEIDVATPFWPPFEWDSLRRLD